MKKTLFVFGLAAIVAMMASCSGSGEEPKNITPTTTEFSAGEVAKYVEVVDQPAELTYTEKEYHQYLRLKVTLKLIQDGIKDVDARDIHFQSSFLGGVYINLVDESGSRIDALSMRSEDDLKFKKFLTGNMGDTAVFVFEVNYGNDELAKERFKNAVQFTPDETPTSIVLGGESNATVSDSDSSDAAVSSDSDGEDWDSLLDSYEEYVDMYVSLLKKASSGDLSAVSEYTSYMSKAQEVSQKMADATSKLSPAQLSRFNKINQKMLQAAQNMN